MENSLKKAMVIGGTTATGGALGAWAWTRLGASYGLKAGPWGMVAGALVGTMAGAALTKAMLGQELEEVPVTTETP